MRACPFFLSSVDWLQRSNFIGSFALITRPKRALNENGAKLWIMCEWVCLCAIRDSQINTIKMNKLMAITLYCYHLIYHMRACGTAKNKTFCIKCCACAINGVLFDYGCFSFSVARFGCVFCSPLSHRLGDGLLLYLWIQYVSNTSMVLLSFFRHRIVCMSGCSCMHLFFLEFK